MIASIARSLCNARELHNDLAIDAINFDMSDDFRKSYEKTHNESNAMVSCPYFSTQFVPISGTYKKKNSHDSFLIYLCVGGEAVIKVDSEEYKISSGETILIPAELKTIEISSESAKLLEVYV